jgi:hypothetical protein
MYSAVFQKHQDHLQQEKTTIIVIDSYLYLSQKFFFLQKLTSRSRTGTVAKFSNLKTLKRAHSILIYMDVIFDLPSAVNKFL